MAAQEGSILPLEMLMKVFSYLDMQELDTIVAPVCRLWRDTSRLPVVRRRLTLNRKIDRSAAHAMLRSSPLLTELIIDCGYTDDLLRTAAEHNLKLRVLRIEGWVSDMGLEAVAQFALLHTLAVDETLKVSDHGLLHLKGLRHLEKLQLISLKRVTAAGWRRLFSISEWPHLRELRLSLYRADRDVQQLQLERFRTTLRSIELSVSVSDIDLLAVAQCEELRALTLDVTIGGTNNGVMHLARLRHLEELVIGGSITGWKKVTPAGWRRLLSECQWPHLRTLCLPFRRFGQGVRDDLERRAKLLCPDFTCS